jgi:hypothetical protein
MRTYAAQGSVSDAFLGGGNPPTAGRPQSQPPSERAILRVFEPTARALPAPGKAPQPLGTPRPGVTHATGTQPASKTAPRGQFPAFRLPITYTKKFSD